MHQLFIRPWWRSFMMNGSSFFHSIKDCIPSDTSLLTIFCDIKSTIDNILILSNHIPTLLHYFSCVAQVFTKYRLSFKLRKCDFCFYHASNMLVMIWQQTVIVLLSPSFPLLNSGLYHHMVCLFSLLLVCVRSITITFHDSNQTSNLVVVYSVCIIVKLFHYKNNLVTSPLLLRYDSSKPTFLKTDWYAGGMGYILMQPDNSPVSIAAIETLQSTGECLFD